MNTDELTKVVKLFYSELDEELSKINTVCLKGCSYCCYHPIYVTQLEGSYVEDHLITNIGLSLFETIQGQWLEWYNKCERRNLFFNYPEFHIKERIDRDNKYYMSDIKCPFLINRECTIYDVRPIICRTYFVKKNPEYCKSRLEPDKEALDIFSKAFDYMVNLHKPDYRHNPFLFLLPGNMEDLFLKDGKIL